MIQSLKHGGFVIDRSFLTKNCFQFFGLPKVTNWQVVLFLSELRKKPVCRFCYKIGDEKTRGTINRKALLSDNQFQYAAESSALSLELLGGK